MVRQGQEEVTSMKARRYELTDKEWALVQPLIPISHTGCPQKDIRVHLNGILWLARSGARWSDLPARFGPHLTVYSCFCRYQKKRTYRTRPHLQNHSTCARHDRAAGADPSQPHHAGRHV